MQWTRRCVPRLERCSAAMLTLLVLLIPACDKQDQVDKKTLSLEVIDYFSGDPIEGIELCARAPVDECQTTGADGIATFQAPGDIVLTVTGVHAGYGDMLYTLRVDSEDAQSFSLGFLSSFHADLMAATVGVSVTPDKGHIRFFAGEEMDFPTSAVGQVSASLTVEAGGTLYYMQADGTGSADASATEDTYGTAGYLNVEPGEWALTLEHPTLTCNPNWALAGEAPGRFRVPVEAGLLTYVAVYCE